MRSFLFASVLAATAFGAPAHAACKHEVVQTHTFHRGTLCSYWTYCYELKVPSDCALPVYKLCIRFAAGLQNLDRSTIESPDGWRAEVNEQTGEICWIAAQRSKRVHPGNSLKGFCVKTVCNPNGVEGIQQWRTFLPAANPGQNGSCVMHDRIAKLFGDAQTRPGQRFLLASLDPDPVAPVVPLFAAPAPAQLPIPNIGVLHLQPATMVLLAMMPVDSSGLAQIRIPLPPNPRLAGKPIFFQAIDLDFTRIRLGNPWTVQIQ